MNGKLWFFTVVAEAALIASMGCCALGLALYAITRGEPRIWAIIVLCLPPAIAAWWIFRKLQTRHTRREARAAAVTFALLSPITLGIAMVLATLSGAYVGDLLGTRFAVVGAFLGVVVVMTLLSFAACAFALSITKCQMRYEALGTRTGFKNRFGLK